MTDEPTHIMGYIPPVAPATTASIGHQIAGRYRLQSLVRRGRHGSVWRAIDLADESMVAMKLLRSGQRQDPESRGRFEREAHLLTRLVHPNVVRLLDWGVAGGCGWYLVLELLEGVRLDRRLATDRLRSREVRSLGLDLLHGLSEAHALGIVHGSVRSDHVVLQPGGAKLIGWSVAAQRHPDQAEDVYSIGALLEEALFGIPLSTPIRARNTQRRLCGPLVTLVARMLHPDPAQRPSTPEALGALAGMARPYVYRVT